MAAGHLITGRVGEDLAASALIKKGMRIVERNFRCDGGEIDLVCEDGATLVFVEVKTRSSAVYGEPGLAVNASKTKRMIRAARFYLSCKGAWARPCRFDFVGIVLDTDEPRIEHWEDVIDVRDGLDRGHASWQPW